MLVGIALALLAVSIPYALVYVWICGEHHDECIFAWLAAVIAAILLLFSSGA